MDYKRAILASIMTYGITLTLGAIAAFGLGIGFEDLPEGGIAPTTWLISGIFSVVATALSTIWYFRKKDIEISLKTGLHLGLVIIAVSFGLDLLSFLSVLDQENTAKLMQTYYGNVAFWLTLALVLVTTTGIAKYKLKKGKAHHAKSK